ncbi:MAG: type I DNA topoisomerase [Solobacterium sp.]|nr:type I DNA topoisomerase [Solobacterium sp.]
MKNLVIVESPSKSKTIAKYLGKDYTVVSSKGHIRDLAIKGKGGLGVDIENGFTPTYEVSDDKKDVVRDLKKQAKDADMIYLATDPDREGEAISWHLAEELGLSEDAVDRVTFHEITKSAVTEAFGRPRTIDMDLVHSQETRRILDRIIGFKLSKLLNTKIRSKSAGRVQSVALKLIVEREKEIQAFKPKEYWTLDALFEKDGIEFTARLDKIAGKKANLHNAAEAQAAYDACQGPFTASSVKASKRRRQPKPPFTTSTLQQEASTKLSMNAKRTMSVAQRLYEGIDIGSGQEGLITYMRTDSTRLAAGFVNDAKKVIADRYGSAYNGRYVVTNDAGAQDAHEAIRPTSLANTPEGIKQYLTSEQYRLYKMIYARALASLMSAAVYDAVSLTMSNHEYDFAASGSTLAFDGYLKVYGAYETGKDVVLPVITEGEQLDAKELTKAQHFTEPPARYTEARLIKALEEEGIGRPSTYAMIIDTIQARDYVELKPAAEGSRTKVFFPTEQGTLTTEKLDQFFSGIINVKYTAEMESKLDDIASGKENETVVLQNFYERFSPMLDEAYAGMEKIKPEEVGEDCPDCGKPLVYRQGRFGKFISCSDFPACKYTRKITDPAKPEPVMTDKLCPKCGKPLLQRVSRYKTTFLGCSGFPSCRYMEDNNGNEIVPKKKTAAKAKTPAKTKRTAGKKA